MNKISTIAKMGIKKGTKLKFKIKGSQNSGMYPLTGEGFVEDFVRNGMLVKTLKGYRVTIHDFDLACKDAVVTVVS